MNIQIDSSRGGRGLILEMVDVILIEMTEVKDQIKDLMTVVIVIEEDIVIEDQDLVSGIMTEDLLLSIIIVLKNGHI